MRLAINSMTFNPGLTRNGSPSMSSPGHDAPEGGTFSSQLITKALRLRRRQGPAANYNTGDIWTCIADDTGVASTAWKPTGVLRRTDGMKTSCSFKKLALVLDIATSSASESIRH